MGRALQSGRMPVPAMPPKFDKARNSGIWMGVSSNEFERLQRVPHDFFGVA